MFRYILRPGTQPGDVVEFAADYFTEVGRRHPDRWYGVVTSVTDKLLVLVETDGPVTALTLSAELLSPSPEEPTADAPTPEVTS